MRHHAKFREDRSHRSGDIADFRFLQKAAVRHLRFVIRVLWVVPTRVKQIQDGVGRHPEDSLYCRDSNFQPLIVSRTP